MVGADYRLEALGYSPHGPQGQGQDGLPRDFHLMHVRHAFASHLANSGRVDLYTLQKLLTYGSPHMTQRYAHLADEALRQAALFADECCP